MTFLQEVTGIYRNNYDGSLNTTNGFPVFATVIEANFITKQDDKMAVANLTDEDVREIIKLSKDEKIADRVSCFVALNLHLKSCQENMITSSNISFILFL